MGPRELTLKVIGETSRESPADSILRKTFARGPKSWGRFRRQVSHDVFNYFRWKGLLKAELPLRVQLLKSLELSDRFRESPQSFSAQEIQQVVPEWLRKTMPVSEEWLRSLQEAPRIWVRCRQGKTEPLETIPGTFHQPIETPTRGCLAYSGSADLFRSTPFQTGCFEIQDISSQWVGAVCRPRPGEVWWDACAGEGGKFLDLADRMENRGLIWVTDRSMRRLRRLRTRAARAEVFNYRWRQADLSRGAPLKTRFDGVLVDAPCSGVGTWRRNPDARWTSSESDPHVLAEIQQGILRAAASRVKPGGKLIYAVCTLTGAETREVVEGFESEGDGFVPDEGAIGAVSGALERGPSGATLWMDGVSCEGNGMFIACWRRL